MEEREEQLYMIDNEIRTLNADEIECRVGTISAKGCSLLLYKDARVDMKVLDETYGVGNWQRTHELINDNLFCTIELWNDKIKQWVKKQDVGIESRPDGTGNEKKGEASDSFKRAGFNVGIGRELYTSPFIWIMPKKDMSPYNTKELVVDDKGETKWEKTEKEFYAYKTDGRGGLVYQTKTTFRVKDIGYNENREINKLVIVDNKDNVRFEMIPLNEQRETILQMPIQEAQKQQLKDKYKDNLDQLQLEIASLGKMKLSQLTYDEANKLLGD